MLWFMSFSPFMVMKNDKLILPLTLRLVACLSCNAAMGFGFKIILENEATGAGKSLPSAKYKHIFSSRLFVLFSVCVYCVYNHKVTPLKDTINASLNATFFF